MGNPMIDGQLADSSRRRQRVIKALNAARTNGAEISVSAIARAASVDRSFLYRHKDLLALIHSAQITPSGGSEAPVTRESLKVDLANAQQRIARLAAHNRKLERKLSELLGENAWRETGLGAPTDIDRLQQRINQLEQRNLELVRELEERDDELTAARAAKSELMSRLNSPAHR
ncbi:DUF6262 family protein [Mycobacterium sp.]|uniref:DUF6262 family protein n=1 Tax=Mycobacterium sp. TaxID=1785 RepID=UPI0025D1EEEE|nr:DUF6262 family protein [Mycobacterium sp.]